MATSRSQIVAIHTNLWNISGVATAEHVDPRVALHTASRSCTCTMREPLSGSCFLHEVDDGTCQSLEGFNIAPYKTQINELREGASPRMRNTARRREGTWTNIFNPMQANPDSTFPSPPQSATSDDDQMVLQNIEATSSKTEIMDCFGFTVDEQSSLLAALKNHNLSSNDVDDMFSSYDYMAFQELSKGKSQSLRHCRRNNEERDVAFEQWLWKSFDQLF